MMGRAGQTLTKGERMAWGCERESGSRSTEAESERDTERGWTERDIHIHNLVLNTAGSKRVLHHCEIL